LGAGCDGRFWRQVRVNAPDENAEAYGEVVWSWRRDAGVKFLRSKLLGDDGDKKARSPAIECTHLCCADDRRLIPLGMIGLVEGGLMSMEVGLGRFGDRRLEKGGRHCMRPWFDDRARSFVGLQGTGRRKSGLRVFCATTG